MITNFKRLKIIELYQKGIALRLIEDFTKCSQSTIMRVLKQSNIKLRGEHCLRINRAKLKSLPNDYLSGKFLIKDLLKKYKIGSEQTLYRILDELKIPRIKPNIKAKNKSQD